MIKRCVDDKVPFTCCLPGSDEQLFPARIRSIRAMLDAGLRVSLHSDDPAMHGTDPGRVYMLAGEELGLDVDGAVQLVMTAVDSAWIDDAERESIRRSFVAEIAQLRERLTSSSADAGIAGRQ